jgi:hypothetical protein
MTCEPCPQRYWAYGSFIQSIPPSQFWIEYEFEEQEKFQELDCWTDTCGPNPQPQYASPCRRMFRAIVKLIWPRVTDASRRDGR